MWYRSAGMELRQIMMATAVMLVGCGPPSDVVVVELCGDVRIPGDIDAVRVSILSADRTQYRAGTLDLLNCGSTQRELPQNTELEAPEGDVWVVAQGLQEGLEVLRFERRLRIEDSGRAQDAVIAMTRSCMRVTCALGLTCINGMCEQAPWADDEVSCSGGGASEGAGGGMAMCTGDEP